MSITLENLPQALNQQHHNICGKSGVQNEENVEYVIDGLAVHVIVNMERIKFDMPQRVAFCGGKLCKDTVKVTITPLNKEVEDLVSSHFKGQILPAMMMMPPTSMFDTVEINGTAK